jgi:MtN3 and saliva related transmembrane protein
MLDPLVRELIGGVGAFLTTAAYLPQAWRTIQTRQTRDLSLVTYIMLLTGVMFWLAYGIALGSWPLIGSNVASIALIGTVLVLKLRHG